MGARRQICAVCGRQLHLPRLKDGAGHRLVAAVDQNVGRGDLHDMESLGTTDETARAQAAIAASGSVTAAVYAGGSPRVEDSCKGRYKARGHIRKADRLEAVLRQHCDRSIPRKGGVCLLDPG
jgi:hypothetical protein